MSHLPCSFFFVVVVDAVDFRLVHVADNAVGDVVVLAFFVMMFLSLSCVFLLGCRSGCENIKPE